ncbi:MAG TPA: hypothetical protein VKC60_17955 [Opitutaceae bacterium]|nr:hypothetical protein [Opitutaceae bacterium]
MNPLLFLAPFFLLFEVALLVLCERYLGIKQIARGADPRALGLGEVKGFLWCAGIFCYWLWMAVLLFQRVGQAQIAGLIAITFIGFALRRQCPLKWALVILTFEGALRVGMLISLCAAVWRTR